MRAVCWNGKRDIRVQSVPDPAVINGRDAIIQVTATAICGSDLHLYNGLNPFMRAGDIVGHEFMGRVVEVGPDVKRLRVGDRVVVPFPIACGACFYCRRQLWSLCDNSNPSAATMETLYGGSTAGLFGYSHMTGGYAGGQAEFVRVPFADVGPFAVPETLSDEQVLLLTDVLPTAFMAAQHCNIQPGDIVAVWGCGPVGLLTQRCAVLLGAERVIAIDHVPERLRLAGAGEERIEVLDCSQRRDVVAALRELTGGRGPDACVDAVGMESHGHGVLAAYDRVKQTLMQETDRADVLRQSIQACRKGGTLSVPGVYAGFADKIPIGALMEKGLTLKTGQTHVHRYLPELLQYIEQGDLVPEEIITHRLPLEDAPQAYATFNAKRDDCIKVVLYPAAH